MPYDITLSDYRKVFVVNKLTIALNITNTSNTYKTNNRSDIIDIQTTSFINRDVNINNTLVNESATQINLVHKLYNEPDTAWRSTIEYKNAGRYVTKISSLTLSDQTSKNYTFEDVVYEWTINPMIVNGSNKSCEYCPYRDICYRDEKAYRIMSNGTGEENGSDS